jgi:hypothetical protein
MGNIRDKIIDFRVIGPENSWNLEAEVLFLRLDFLHLL